MSGKRTKKSGKAKFCWRGKGFHGVSAQHVGEELARIGVSAGQIQRTDDVLEASRDPATYPALHNCIFHDSDEEAAEEHRKHLVRGLLRSISVRIVEGERVEKRPCYVHLRDEEGPRYVRAEEVASNEELRQRALEEALSRLIGVRKIYHWIRGLNPQLDNVFDAIDELDEAG